MLTNEITSALRRHSAEVEAAGMLTAEQLQLIQAQKWLHLFVPKAYGGLALSLPEAVRLEESIAYADGNVGWIVTLCAGAAMFIGYMNETLVREIFTDADNLCISGSGQPSGYALPIGDEYYEVTGSWPYASGAAHATWFTANCVIQGDTAVRSFIFKKEEVSLSQDWNYTGLNGTSGYSFSVQSLKIPANRCFLIQAEHARLPDPVYTYPFLSLAVITISANVSGMCLYFFELAEEMLYKKQANNALSEAVKQQGIKLLDTARLHTQSLRSSFYASLDGSWASHVAGVAPADPEWNALIQTSTRLAVQSRNLVNELFPFCGMEAARTGTPINQVWRNINTASQHVLLSAFHNS